MAIKTDEFLDSSIKIRRSTEFGHLEVVDDVMCEILKKKSPLERLKIGFGLWSSARKQLFHYLRSLHPDWDEKRISSEVIRRISHGAA